MTQRKRKQHACEWHEAFLAALRNSANIRMSCSAAGISRQAAYSHRNEEPEFAAQWAHAWEEAIDLLEWELSERARKGDTTALIFALKGLRPERWRETQRHEVTGAQGGPIVFEVVYDDDQNPAA